MAICYCRREWAMGMAELNFKTVSKAIIHCHTGHFVWFAKVNCLLLLFYRYTLVFGLFGFVCVLYLKFYILAGGMAPFLWTVAQYA